MASVNDIISKAQKKERENAKNGAVSKEIASIIRRAQEIEAMRVYDPNTGRYEKIGGSQSGTENTSTSLKVYNPKSGGYDQIGGTDLSSQFDADVLKAVEDKYKSQWGDKYYYDMFDPEDFARSMAGSMPKYLDKTYDLDDPIDQYLYRNNLPAKATFSDMYSEAAQEINAARKEESDYQNEYANFRNELYKSLDAARMAGEDYTETFTQAATNLLLDPKYANVAQHFTGYADEDIPEEGTWDFYDYKRKQAKKTVDERSFTPQSLLDEYETLVKQAEAKANAEAYVASTDPVQREQQVKDKTLKLEEMDEQIETLKRELRRDRARAQGVRTPDIEAKREQLSVLEQQRDQLQTDIEAVTGTELEQQRAAAQQTMQQIAEQAKTDGSNWSAAVDSYWDATDRDQDKRVAGLIGAAYVANGMEDQIPEILRPALEGNNFIAEMQELFQYATPEDIETFNRVIASGEDNAIAFYEALTDELKFRAVNAREEEATAFANEHGARASVRSVFQQFPAAVEGLGNAIGGTFAESLGIDPVDVMYNSEYTNRANTYTQTVAQNIANGTDKESTGKVLSFLYQTGMSMAQTGARMGLGGAGLAVAGLNAASSAMNSVLEQGGTLTQATWIGAVAGAAEAITEKVSLDSLLKAKARGTVGGVIKEALKQSAIEGTEEVSAEVINMIADEIARSSDSDLRKEIAALVSEGMTEQEAITNALVNRIGGAFLGGALSGLLFGTGGQVARIVTTPGKGFSNRAQTVETLYQEVGKIAPEISQQFAADVYSLGLSASDAQFLVETFDGLVENYTVLATQQGQDIVENLTNTMHALSNKVSEQTYRAAAKQRRVINKQTKMYDGILAAQQEAHAALESGDIQAHKKAAAKFRAAMQEYMRTVEVDNHEKDADLAKKAQQDQATAQAARKAAEQTRQMVENAVTADIEADNAVQQAAFELGTSPAQVRNALGDDIVSQMVAMQARLAAEETMLENAGQPVDKLSGRDDIISMMLEAEDSGNESYEFDVIGQMVLGEKTEDEQEERLNGSMPLSASENYVITDQRDLLREWRKADSEKRRERAEAKKYRDRIESNSRELYRWLQTPDKKRHVPIALQNTVAKLLENIDIEGKRPSKKATAWRDAVRGLSDLYKDYAAGRGSLYESGVYFSVPDAVLDALDMLTSSADTSRKLGDLNPEELRSLDFVIAVTKNAVSSMNKLYANKRYKVVSTLAERTINEASGQKQKDYGTIGRLLIVDQLDSFSWARMLGDGAESIIDALEKGAEKSYGKIKQGADFVKSTLGGVGVKRSDLNKWSKDTVAINLASGQEVRMTQAQLMSLYALSKREQARKHILAGGIEVADFGKGMRQLDAFSVSENDLDTMFDSLTDVQKNITNELQGFLSNDAAAWGNEAWVELYQYEMFGEKNYWPIKAAQSASEESSQATTKKSERMINRLVNIGVTKTTNEKATNPIIIEDAFDVFTEHVAQMARLNGLAAPVEDAIKWYNYIGRTASNAVNYNRTTKKAIERVFGSSGVVYFKKLIDDINGLSSGGSGTEISSKLMTAYKRAAVAGKLRVVVQQPTSIIRAAAFINPKFFIGESENTIRENIREMQDKNPLAWWKAQGNYEIGAGRSMRGILFGPHGTIDAITDAAMQPAGAADNLAWGALWSAVKREVKAYNKGIEVDTEEYWEKVIDRFNDIVNQSQVVDSVMHRSQAMRSKDNLAKQATSFMSEPTKTYNMARNAFVDARLGKPNAGKKLASTLIALLMSIAANGAVKGLHDTLRDREKDDDFGEVLWKKIKDNIKGDINPLGYVPYLRDAWSIIQGYNAERLDMSALSDAWSSISRVWKHLNGETSKYSDYKLYTDLAKTVSSLLGIPLPGLIDLINVTVNTISPGTLPKERKVRTDSEKEAYASFLDSGMDKRIARDIIGDFGGSNKAQKALSVAQYADDLDDEGFRTMLEVLEIDYSGKQDKYVEWAVENGEKSLEQSKKKAEKGDLKQETLEKYENIFEEYFRQLGMMD